MALAAVACGTPDTGILLEVTAQDLQPDRLAFVIGAELQVGQDAVFVADRQSSISATVTGRDLATDPYRLLVHDGLGASAPMSGAVLAYSGTTLVGFVGLPSTPFVPEKVLLYRLALGGVAGVTVLPTGCVTWTASGEKITIAGPDDHDCDGYVSSAAGGPDCNDEDPKINPGVDEVCANGIDDNCNGETDESPDADGDGFHLCDGDCDDHDPNVHPGATEICDGKDNDCNGKCDDLFDADHDGYTTCGTHIESNGSCTEAPAPDCNDDDAAIHPGATEICDGKDNDCNGVCDDGGLDRDGDGFTSCGTLADLPAPANGICGAKTSQLVDCREGTGATAKAIHPFAHQFCDGIDDSCDGKLETVEPCFAPVSGDMNPCVVGNRACDDDRSDGSSGLAPNCVPEVVPLFVDHALCDAYTGSPCKDDAEPWRCANAAAAAQILDCTLAYTRDVGTALQPTQASLCPGGSAPAPNLGAAENCIFNLIGGITQESYVGGFRAPSSAQPPAATFLGCTAELVVTAATNDVAPQPDEWVIVVGDPGHMNGGQSVVVDFTPTLVTACPTAPMSCTMRKP